MKNFFKSRLLRSMVPYFLLGVLLIIAFFVVSGIGFFTEHISQFWSVVTPFFVGGVIAYILNLPCSTLQKQIEKVRPAHSDNREHVSKGMRSLEAGNRFTGDNFRRLIYRRSRGLSVLALFLIIIALLVVIIMFIAPAVSQSVQIFIRDIEEYERTIRGWIATVESWNLPGMPENLDTELIAAMTGFVGNLDAEGLASTLMDGFGAGARFLFNMILVIISSIYFLIGKDDLKAFVKKAIAAISSGKTNETILTYSQKLNHNFHMYIYTQTIDGIILGTLMTVLLLLIGSPHALLLGLILGFVNYIPYFGSIFGTIFAVVVVAFTQDIPTAAVAAIFMFALQQLDANFIQPKLMGGSFSLSPLLIIISVTIGMAYGGVLGMLVAIPIVAILKDLVDDYVAYREAIKRNPPPREEEYF